MADFTYEGYRLNYTDHGDGPDTTVLLPGLLLPQTMQFPLARQLARRGHRVITLDPLGHGRSDRPVEMWNYSMGDFALQTIALLDHLELERAVVGGTSLGANITLEIAIGSSSQVALFVAPSLVFISLAVGHPMDFVFTGFEIATVAIATLIVTVLCMDGRSNWLEGAQLLGTYVIIAAAAFFVGI